MTNINYQENRYDLNILCTRPTMVKTGGEWNLIHSRNVILHEKYGIKLKMTVLLPADSYQSEPVHFKTAPYPVEVILYERSRRGIINSVNDFYLKAIREDYQTILTSGNGFALLATKYFGAYQGRLIIDIHNDLAELYEYSSPKRYLWDLMRYHFFSLKYRRLIRRCDAALVVTKTLAGYVKKVNPNAKPFRVPCACNQMLTYDEYRINRCIWREKLNISPDDIVFTYAGALNKWQGINEHLDIVAECCERDRRVRAVFFTGEINTMHNLIDKRCSRYKERISVLMVDSNVLVNALCAADIGLLVRRDDRTNHAAFPNKFDEYLAAGLKVITTSALRDVAKVVRENKGLGLLVDHCNISSETESILSFAKKDVPISMDRFREIQEIRIDYSFEARLKDLAGYLRVK